jgi:hypothetical protein
LFSDDWQGAYILRTLLTSQYSYDTAKEKLLSLPIGAPGRETMRFASAADEQMEYGDDCQNSIQGSLMRLGATINLESKITVRSTSHSYGISALILVDWLCWGGAKRYHS